MKRLWAPWRMEYIESAIAGERGCFLCAAARGSDDRKSLVVHRGEKCFVIMNRFPYNNGHVMVAPYRHVAELGGLSREEGMELLDLVALSISVLREVMRPDGFNVGINLGRAAGAGVEDHLHVHVVPRWAGDTNFMPVLADVKVIPELLEQTYDKLRAAFERAKG